jgi:hypothetical protein
VISARLKIDPNFEEVTEDVEEAMKESLRRKWAQLEAMFGTDKRAAGASGIHSSLLLEVPPSLRFLRNGRRFA